MVPSASLSTEVIPPISSCMKLFRLYEFVKAPVVAFSLYRYESHPCFPTTQRYDVPSRGIYAMPSTSPLGAATQPTSFVIEGNAG